MYVKNKDTFQAELDDELCLFNTLDAKFNAREVLGEFVN